MSEIGTIGFLTLDKLIATSLSGQDEKLINQLKTVLSNPRELGGSLQSNTTFRFQSRIFSDGNLCFNSGMIMGCFGVMEPKTAQVFESSLREIFLKHEFLEELVLKVPQGDTMIAFFVIKKERNGKDLTFTLDDRLKKEIRRGSKRKIN